MKRSTYLGIAALAVAALVVTTMVRAAGETAEVACPCPLHNGSTMMKDAKVAVQNIADGVTITITAANADQVKVIQTAFANCGKATNAACPMMNPAMCQKMHAAGSCTVPGATPAATIPSCHK